MCKGEKGGREAEDWEKYWILHLSFGVWYLYRSGKSGRGLGRMGSSGINNGCEYLVRGERGAGGVHTGR